MNTEDFFILPDVMCPAGTMEVNGECEGKFSFVVSPFK